MTLPVSRLVRVTVNLSPIAAARRSFGILLVCGDSNVIDGEERVRSYDTYEGVTEDFGVNAPESEAAALYFGQSPAPATVMIGRWFRTASSGFNQGGVLTAAQQLMSAWTVISNGTFEISIDGAAVQELTGLDFSAETTLNGVAAVITADLTGATCTWTGDHFVITSATTGASSTVGYAIPQGTGTDISAQLKLSAATATNLVSGYAAETPAECAALMANFSTAWYGLMFNASTQPTADQSIAVSAVIEALDLKRIYGVTTQDANTLSSGSTTDLAYLMEAAGYLQSFIQYSSSSKAAIASFFGRAFAVNFNANRSTITMMFKQEPGVTGEDLTTTQANVLEAKRCNVFIDYVNDTTIIQYGTMSGPAFFDEIHGLDWFQDAIQNAVYNVLYTSKTKVPQTDAGLNQLTTAIAGACEEAVNNGLVAPGVWNAAGFGELETGAYLKDGYYIFAQPMSEQSQAERESRVSPPIQVAIKLAGAIQEVDVIIDVNR